jgi:hypothetical protein
MTVLFVIDIFDIDREDALIVNSNEFDIEQTRQKIYQHLRNNDLSLLRIKLKSKSLFNRFKDFEGLNGVLPTQNLIPRLILANILCEELPDWLSDELIVQLGFLKIPQNKEFQTPMIDKLIAGCGSGLLSKDFLIFINNLKNQSPFFLKFLKVEAIQQRFIQHFESEFDWADEVALLFVERLLAAKTVPAFLTLVAYEQHQDLLRQLITSYHLTLPLAARTLPSSLLAIPMLDLSELDAKELPLKWLKTMDELVRKVEKNELEAKVLADLVVSPWERLLLAIRGLADTNISFITPELIERLVRFDTEDAKLLADDLSRQLALQSYAVLSESATIEDVFIWTEGYFESIRQSFISGQGTPDDLNQSFTHWLLKQSARIARSANDWRQFSKRVESYLEQEYLVIICMVDALSALNQDILDEAIAKIDHLDIRKEILFAPLPTLTEIGKMAVLTGIETHKLVNDQESALRDRYKAYLPDQNSLKVIKSWKTASEHIDDKTNLLVFFENRIDERLHDCVDFSKHRKDVSTILGQMIEAFNRWKKDAGYLNRDVVFFITADHGMTVVQSQYQGPLLGEVKERVFKVNAPPVEDNDDFSYIKKNQNNEGYLVPKKRLGLSKSALLTHGGLTPEEVLIPFVTLTSRLPSPGKTPLELNLLSEKCLRITDKAWQISIELMASVALNNIKIKFNEPFVANELIDSIRENRTQKILINFTSSYEQIGLTEIDVRLSYEREGAHEINNKQFSCVFPEPLIQKDADTQGFEDMFS